MGLSIMSSNIVFGQKWLYLECTQITDMHKPPSYPMFGGPRKTPVKQRSDSQTSPTTSTAISPASRTMELRGKCISHIKELVGLRDVGALTQEEFDKERQFYIKKMDEYR